MCNTLCDNEKLTRESGDLVKVVNAHNEITYIIQYDFARHYSVCSKGSKHLKCEHELFSESKIIGSQ